MLNPMPSDITYYDRYTELQSLIINAYKDFYILKEFDHYNNQVSKGTLALPKCSFSVVKHICQLVLLDLGLTLWKLTDGDSESNTLKSINTYLRTEHHKLCNYSYSAPTKHTLKVLDDIRNEYLAHNDIDKTGIEISVSSLKAALDDVKDHLNSLCYSDIDSRVQIIENQIIFKESYEMQLGLAVLLNNANTIDSAECGESIGDDYA